MRITVIPSDGVRAEIVLENDELGNAPYVRCGPDGTVVLEFGDDIDLTDLRGKPDPDDNLAEEMADVYICLEMLRDMYGVTDKRLESWIDRKTKRQAERNRA